MKVSIRSKILGVLTASFCFISSFVYADSCPQPASLHFHKDYSVTGIDSSGHLFTGNYYGGVLPVSPQDVQFVNLDVNSTLIPSKNAHVLGAVCIYSVDGPFPAVISDATLQTKPAPGYQQYFTASSVSNGVYYCYQSLEDCQYVPAS